MLFAILLTRISELGEQKKNGKEQGLLKNETKISIEQTEQQKIRRKIDERKKASESETTEKKTGQRMRALLVIYLEQMN